MVLNDHGKLIFLLVAFASIVLLLAFGRIDEAVGTGLIGTLVGYVTGNGVLAVKRQDPSPVLAPRRENTGELPVVK